MSPRSMRVVVGHFQRFSSLVVSNVYLLDGGSGDLWLVDSGHWSERLQLLAELRAAGLRPSQLAGVLLTHRHSDHAGNAAYLQRAHGVRVFAHRADADVLAGLTARVPVADRGRRLERAFGALENLVPAKLTVDTSLDHGDIVAGLEVHHVPGHTEGSVLFRHSTASCLLTGDTLLTAIPPLTIRPGIVGAHPAFSVDVARAHASLQAFHARGLDYQHLLPGHGPPLVGRARERVLRALAKPASTGAGAGTEASPGT